MNKAWMWKLLAIGVVLGVILGALGMVNGTITDRQEYRDQALKSILASYAGPQTLVGPVLVRPYKQTTVTFEDGDKGTKKRIEHVQFLTATSFPRVLDVRGAMKPSERKHGLYSVNVYEFAGHLQGQMEIVQPHTDGVVEWGEPYLAMAIDDVRGIVGRPVVMVNGTPETVFQEAESPLPWQPNLKVPLHVQKELSGKVDFTVDLTLAGAESLSIAPVGDSNHMELTSTWHTPLFAGKYLPRVWSADANGFKAAWDLSSLAAGTQAQMASKQGRPTDLMNATLVTPIDPHRLSDRATKYGILFVVLTFGGFFLFEMMKELPIHPVQYLLVGFGLAIFFLLLVSLSEHMAFGLAYLLSSVACISLLTFYLSYVLHSTLRGAGFGAMLTMLYSAIYGILQSEDNALVLGALLLFAVLAAVMVVTRKVDWYRSATLAVAPVPTHGL